MSDLVPKSLVESMARWRKEAKSWIPHAYQERAIKCLLENNYFGLLLSPGMGKTATTLAALTILLKKKMVHRALIVAPLRACSDVWPEEVATWKEFQHLGVAVLHGSGKDKILRSLRPEHQVCIINPEGFQWLTSSKVRLKLLSADMLVIDESGLWRNSRAVRFRCLRPLLSKFSRRYILTGSPRPRNYLDLHAQIMILDGGAALGQYITHYRNNFFFPTGWQGHDWEILPGAAEKINALVAPLVLRLEAKDYLRLPNEIEQTHRVELPAAARKEYDSIEGMLMSTLFTTPLTNSAAARSKCAQIANGSVYLDAEPVDDRWPTKVRPVKVVHTAKVDALVELYNELQGEPILVAIGFRHDVDAIRKAMGKDIPCINGETTRMQAADYIARWNKGLIPMLLGHPASMAHGINMQKFSAQHVAYFSLPDDYDLYLQFFLRVCRQGNKSAFVIKHHFVTQNTIDIAKMRNLKKKGAGQKAFLDAMKEYAEAKYGPLKVRP